MCEGEIRKENFSTESMTLQKKNWQAPAWDLAFNMNNQKDVLLATVSDVAIGVVQFGAIKTCTYTDEDAVASKD